MNIKQGSESKHLHSAEDMLELRTLSSDNAKDNYNSTLLPENLKQEMSLEIPGKRVVSEQSNMDMEDPNCEARNIAEPTKTASIVPQPESDMPKKEMEFFLSKEVDFCMNKSVEETDQPTKIVDIEKETYQVVKDICVDEGFHPQNKDLSYENTTHPMPALEESEFSTGKENVTNRFFEDGTELYKIRKIMDKVSEDILLKQEHEHDRQQYDMNDYNSLDDQLKSVDSDGSQQQYFDCSDGQESENQDFADVTSSSTLTTESSNDKSENNADISSIEGARIYSTAEENTAVDVAILPQSSVGSCGCNAMIESGPENSSSSGIIFYTGQIPYSGSISLRSDSSTGSTRSFAFPVLQSEWNQSPVKMAKADRSRYGKTRAWGKMLCCSF